MKIAYMVGPPSSMSLSRSLAKTFVSLVPEGVESVDLNVGSLPLYNRDYDGNQPKVATVFKKVVDEADGVAIITSEHNRMCSAAIVNAIEWSSRLRGTASLEGKPVVLVGISLSPAATGIAQTHLRGPFTFSGPKFYPHEAYTNAQQAGITPEGDVAEGSRDLLAQFTGGFVDFVKVSK